MKSALPILALALLVPSIGGATDTVSPPPSFAVAKIYSTGAGPRAVAAFDVNGDGRPDIVSVNYGQGSVSVLANRGDGMFLARAIYATRESPLALATGDVDGDGDADLVTANGDSVSVLRNTGGTFPNHVDRDSGGDALAEEVGLGDVSRDGKLDLVAAGGVGDPGTVSVFPGLGDGTFGEGAIYPTERHPVALAIGDLTGDGRPEIVTASARLTVSVLANRGDGTLGPASAYRTADGPDSIVIADLNADGRNDIATADSEFESVSVLLKRGAGFARTEYDTGAVPVAISAADLNGDGRPDLVTADSESKAVSVLANAGRGRFHLGIDHFANDSSESLAIADLNGDGRPDVAAGHYWSNRVSVLFARPGLCAVQTVTRLRLTEAERILALANCRIRVHHAYSRVKRGRVVSQQPKFGAVLAGKTRVRLVVSRGRKRS